jgi:hypothetical protein
MGDKKEGMEVARYATANTGTEREGQGIEFLCHGMKMENVYAVYR